MRFRINSVVAKKFAVTNDPSEALSGPSISTFQLIWLKGVLLIDALTYTGKQDKFFGKSSILWVKTEVSYNIQLSKNFSKNSIRSWELLEILRILTSNWNTNTALLVSRLWNYLFRKNKLSFSMFFQQKIMNAIKFQRQCSQEYSWVEPQRTPLDTIEAEIWALFKIFS